MFQLFGQVYPVLVEEFEAVQQEKKNKKPGYSCSIFTGYFI
jgi:hypothetical protein